MVILSLKMRALFPIICISIFLNLKEMMVELERNVHVPALICESLTFDSNMVMSERASDRVRRKDIDTCIS